MFKSGGARRGLSLTVLKLGLAASLILSAGSAQAQRDFKSAVTVADRAITQEQLRDYLTFIASDELEGRDTPSRGLDIAAKFLAVHLSRWGLKPMGGDGSYFQNITLSRRNLDSEATTAALGEGKLTFMEDYAPQLQGTGGTASGEVVYAGHGWFVRGKGVDAYKGLDVRGKVVLITGRPPAEVDLRQVMAEGKRIADWMDPQTYARERGAVGVAVMAPVDTREGWDGFTRGVTRVTRGYTPEGREEATLPAIWLAPSTLEKLLAGESKSVTQLYQEQDGESFTGGFALSPGKRLSFKVALKVEQVTTRNVVAVLEGSDARLKDEYVALGAHYDHVGISSRGSGDIIFNGADDDGSGTVALLAIAEAMAQQRVRPLRSILFVWHCGEEKGLWGSQYFVENPTVPLEKISAQVNLDMIGRSKPAGDTNRRNAELTGPNGIYVIGSTMLSTELGELTRKVNQDYLKLEYDYRYDDPADPNRFFYRSDHYNYARKGIPILFYFDGVHVDYHRVGDEVEKIDFEKMARVTRTVLVTVAEIANRPAKLKVDKKLDR